MLNFAALAPPKSQQVWTTICVSLL
jgi:hypothetical protein